MQRALFVGVGLVLGLIAGAFTAAAVIVIGAATFWLFVFGDDGNPGWAETVLLATALVCAAAVALLGAYAGWLRGGTSR